MNKKPSSMTPLGMKVAKGPAQAEAAKITNNNDGWAEVANIPVPPAAEKRDFSKPLKQVPFLVNGGTVPLDGVDVVADSETDKKDPEEIKPSSGSFFKYEKAETKTVMIEINWHGAQIALSCLNVVYQPADFKRGIEGWLMLELSIDNKNKMPAWIPPVAQLAENGTIYVPEFDCRFNNKLFKCQVLNIDLLDEPNKKRVFVFRVIEFTEFNDAF
jgi:hypothetical protein